MLGRNSLARMAIGGAIALMGGNAMPREELRLDDTPNFTSSSGRRIRLMRTKRVNSCTPWLYRLRGNTNGERECARRVRQMQRDSHSAADTTFALRA